LALLSSRDRGPAERPRGALGEGAGARAQVAGALLLRQHEVLGAVHVDELRGEVEQQGRVELAAVHRPVGVFEVVREVEGEHVDGEDAGLAGAQGRERLLVRIVAVGGEDDEAFDARLLPGSEQIVHPAVQRLAADGGVAGEGPLGGGVDAIFDRRGAEDLERPGEVVGQTLDDDGVAPEREVGAVLFARSHRYEEAGIALKHEAHLVGDEGLEVQRRAHVALAGCAATIAAAALLPREGAFERVRDATRSGSRTPGVERGVVILAPDGEPVAWAGRHRFVPARDTAELRAVITPFYVSLEARRQTLDGGSAVGSVLLDAVPAAPDRGRAVSAQFEAGYGVALRFYTPGLAPREPDVFDYCPISCERGDTLFSVQPVPPSQGDAKLAALRGATQRGGAALAVALVLLALVAPAGRWRWLVVLAAAWCAARAPLGSSLRTAELFSPAAFYRPALGVYSALAAHSATTPAASALWRRGLARRWWNVAGAAVLVTFHQ